jgi:hypothetical protein
MKVFQNIAFALILLLPMSLLAQETLPTGEVEVIRSFDARLLDTEPVQIQPELPPLDTTTKRLTYSIFSKNLEVEYLPPRIRPLAQPTEGVQDVYNGYARLGGGFPASLYADASYDVFSEENYNFGIDLFHHSANNNNNIENQRFAFTKLGAGGTYYLDQGFAVNANLGYTIDNVHFYGYNEFNEENNTDISLDAEDVRQSFTTFDVGAKIFNGQRTRGDFNYYAGFDIYLMQDDYAARENGFDLRLGAKKWIADQHEFNVELRTDFTTYKDTANQSLNNFFLTPNFVFHGDIFRAKIGVNVASHEDEFFLFPDLEVSASILGSSLAAFVGATGSLQKNNFRSLSDYNPFISSRIEVENTNFVQYYGGIKGNFQGIEYRAQVSYEDAESLALFQTNQDSIPRFNVLYDTAQIFSIHGSVTFPVLEGLDVTGSVTQNFFSLDNQEKPWHLPSFTLNGGLRYTTLEGQLLVKGDVFIENGVPFLNEDGNAENLNALFDISLGADYQFTENIGAFVQVNNLANNRRQRWRYYPIFGLNALVGVSARF